jgi:16S rRNA (guanine527-N7)-methyltransferase
MTLIRSRPVQTGSSWGSDESASLESGLGELGVSATVRQLKQLRTYGELLLKWNRTYNLLGATDAAALVQDHLLDSLATLPALERWLPPGSILSDIGSGAGLPGIVLAIMFDHLPIRLIEPNGKKAAFLRQVVAHCSLSRVQVTEARIEELDGIEFGPHGHLQEAGARPVTPHFICRAFTSLNRFATLSRPHLQDGSMIFSMKAARVADELAELDGWIEVLAVEALRSPGKDVQRNLVVMRSRAIDQSRRSTPSTR